MSYHFSGGTILALVFLTLVIALPMKLAAHFAGAARTGLAWCGAAVGVGLVSGAIASWLVGGVIGGPLAAFLGFVVGVRLMLGTNMVAAVGISVIAFGLSLLGLSILAHVGLSAAQATDAVSV